jgi:alcohol dehydrogenase YqhD (iron-dependent ADH family)
VLKKYPVRAALPIYGVLTLSGTSSEINKTGVLTDEESMVKRSIAHELLFPRVSIVDPTLQYSVPLQQVRHSGFDALSHILEAYFARMDTCEVIMEHCESYAGSIIRCLRALPDALNDYATRSELAFCSIYAHSGWVSVGRSERGDFSSHRIGHAVGALFGLPHGVTLGLIMPHWAQYIYNRGVNHDVLARFACRIMGIARDSENELASAGINAFKDFIRSLDMPVNLGAVGIKAEDIPALVENAAQTLPFGAVIPMDRENIAAVLELAL